LQIITITMTTALRLHETGSIKGGLSMFRVKQLEGQKVRCFRCDRLGVIGHMAGSCSAEPEFSKRESSKG